MTQHTLRETGFTRVAFHDVWLHSHFQPIYSLSHERVIGYEALIRGDRDGVKVSPWEIFSSAEGFEQTVTLDRLCRAIHLRNFQRHIQGNAWLFVNINPKVVVGGRHYGSFFAQLLHSTGIPPQRIVVEILENAIQDEALLAETVDYYRDIGCLVALDDFGAGHSNFDRIIRIRPDIVKMDTQMIRQAGHNRIARRILPNLVAMLHEAGCLVLIEGVETETEALIALDANVDFVQGFYFAHPGTPESFPDHSTTFSDLNHHHRLQFDADRRAKQQELKGYKQQFAQAAAFYASGIELEMATRQLLEMEHVQRCYVLDEQGKQIGESLYPLTRQVPLKPHFLPLADTRGADWNRKPYFRNAIVHPGKVKVTRPYLSITGVELCITLSISTEVDRQTRILCCDISHRDES
ncbi:MAG: EAL domain-containing protein [Pseudomonadota bacterium]